MLKSLGDYTSSPVKAPNHEAIKIKIKPLEDIDFAGHLNRENLQNIKSKGNPISIIKDVLVEDALVAVNVNLRS